MLGLFYVIEHLFRPVETERAVFYGMSAYVIYSVVSRLIMARSYQDGMRLYKKGRFKQAISAFQKSYDFFKRHQWIDRLRGIVLLSPSVTSYREMSLLNIAFCYGYMGNAEESKAYFARALEEFPNSTLARVGLNTIRVFERNLEEVS